MKARHFPLFVLLVLVPFLAWAQEAAEAASGLPHSEEAFAQLILNAVLNKQWAVLASAVLTAVVWGLRRYTPEKTKLGGWLRTRVGGILSTLALSLSGAFLTLFVAGAPLDVGTVVKAINIALTANGMWSIVKNLRESAEEKKAVEAGKEAEKAPTDVVNQ